MCPLIRGKQEPDRGQGPGRSWILVRAWTGLCSQLFWRHNDTNVEKETIKKKKILDKKGPHFHLIKKTRNTSIKIKLKN